MVERNGGWRGEGGSLVQLLCCTDRPYQLPAVCQDLREASFLQTPSTFPCYGPWLSVENDAGTLVQSAFRPLSNHRSGYCDLECPVPTFAITELRRAATLSLVLGWVGYVLTLVVFCVMVFSKRCAHTAASDLTRSPDRFTDRIRRCSCRWFLQALT